MNRDDDKRAQPANQNGQRMGQNDERKQAPGQSGQKQNQQPGQTQGEKGGHSGSGTKR
ncbi:hypothetical protein [Legionella hackeliae]|uniref:Uncharacterized protein n=1 Tax=Legionella hackeliae TaxID=449 RepID=A0A0A8UKK0_LEGHA|nr:hypothetical protein [Legionella hackeliae]KTD12933.1 hypothetical protein Lhac_1804 [Legionella hackeliae]CEK09243.1 protein of unknown function [Legionella hackeliae]STX49150.1 Uncharacterised protein [Legionella hackeliae]